MEVITIARATGPYGEIEKRRRLTSANYPTDYLKHLVEIGVARVDIEHAEEPVLEVKVKESKKPSIVSQQAQASRKKTARKSKTKSV